MTRFRRRYFALAAVTPLVFVGCAGLETRGQVGAPEIASDEAVEAEVPAQRELLIARADEEGQPLHLRCVVSAGGAWDPLAIHDGEGIALMTLDPGRYKVMVYADPGPFGFDVVIPPERSQVEVQIFSRGSGHTVVTETRREVVGEGVVMVERQLLGLGWGPRPALTVPQGSLAERVERADRERDRAPASQISAARRREAELSAALREAVLRDAGVRDAAQRRHTGSRQGSGEGASPRGGDLVVAP